MRRYLDIINEAWFSTIPTSHLGDVDVWKNPTRAETFKLLRNDEYHNARALVTPQDVYLFSANLSHGDVEHHFGWPRNTMARIFVDANGPYINESDDMAMVGRGEEWDDFVSSQSPEDIAHVVGERRMCDEWCSDHPVLRRIFPGYKLGIR